MVVDLETAHESGSDAEGADLAHVPQHRRFTRPDDDATIAAVYASLMAPSTTVNGGTVLRVKPGDPANSFLVVKMADQQGTKGYMCTNQEPNTSSQPCGTAMPQSGDLYCMGTARKRFDAVARWVAEGAPNN